MLLVETVALTIQQAFDLARRHHQAGQFAEAEQLYRQILSQQPEHAEALHCLGVIALQAGRDHVGADLIRRAIALKPDYGEAHGDFGNVLKRMGQLDESIAACRRAVALRPDIPEAHSNLGDVLREKGQLDESIAVCRHAIALKPSLPEAHNNLANALKDNGQLDEAIEAYRQAIALKPDYPEAHSNLGNALRVKGRVDQAIAACRRAIALRHDFAEAHGNLGDALQDSGQVSQAIDAYRQAIALRPDFPEAHSSLGDALRKAGRLDEAIAVCRRAIALRATYAQAHNNLGNALKDNGQLDASIEAYRQAIALKPDLPEAHNNLGVLKETGQLDEAVATFRQALALDPGSASTDSNLVYTLHFHPAYDGPMIAEELQRWNRQHAEPFSKFVQPHANDPDPDRRLRIGYVSPDFREHVVGWNLLPFFLRHDHGQFEIYCYANVRCPDARTRQFQQNADRWRNIMGLSDEQVAALVRQDQIDILVDLTLHTANNRLLVFARKPAPVQVSYLGYCGSTGMSAMDYRLSDPHLDPIDAEPAGTQHTDPSHYAEKTVRLPRTYWCYQPAGPACDPSPPPALQNGFVTFGCLNSFSKVSVPAQDLWAAILAKTPDSRLILHAPPGKHLEDVARRFAHRGVEPHRVRFVGKQTWASYAQTYSQIDIALDPFPYGGGITTCDALWMGVPVVSLSGKTAVGRGGRSILSNLGLPELLAFTPDQYARIAVELSQDMGRMHQLRHGMRDRMLASALMDAEGFARDIESAYRQMWRNWCQARLDGAYETPSK